jgi:Rgg/GadR/MutR family transcriptional activator
MGKLFKKLRLSRGITLEEATGDYFSVAQLSKFENGISDITITKLLYALNAIAVNLEEFITISNSYKQLFFKQLAIELKQAHDTQDIQTLINLYNQEKNLAFSSKHQKFHALNSIVIATTINKLDSNFPVSEIAKRKISDYLFSVSQWGNYELFLILNNFPQTETDLLISITNEMLDRTEFYQNVPENKMLVLKILINSLNQCSDNNKFKESRKFIEWIEELIDESDLYNKVPFLYAKGYYQIKLGNQEEGKQMMKDAIDVFHKLDCFNLEKLYKNDYIEMFKEDI